MTKKKRAWLREEQLNNPEQRRRMASKVNLENVMKSIANARGGYRTRWRQTTHIFTPTVKHITHTQTSSDQCTEPRPMIRFTSRPYLTLWITTHTHVQQRANVVSGLNDSWFIPLPLSLVRPAHSSLASSIFLSSILLLSSLHLSLLHFSQSYYTIPRRQKEKREAISLERVRTCVNAPVHIYW